MVLTGLEFAFAGRCSIFTGWGFTWGVTYVIIPSVGGVIPEDVGVVVDMYLLLGVDGEDMGLVLVPLIFRPSAPPFGVTTLPTFCWRVFSWAALCVEGG